MEPRDPEPTVPVVEGADCVEAGSHATCKPGWNVPVLIGSFGLFASVLMTVALRRQEWNAAETAARSALAEVAGEIEGQMALEIADLEELALEWERSGRLAHERWRAGSRRLLERHGHIQAVEWADPGFHVRWIEPLAGNEPAQNLDLAFEPRRRQALELSRDLDEIVVTKPVELVQGGRGVLVHVPLRVAGRFEGFIVGVYRLESLLSSITRKVAPGYGIEIRAAEDTIFRRDQDEARGRGGKRVSRTIQVASAFWTIETFHGPETRATFVTPFPLLVFYAGGLTSLLLAILLNYERVARWRACLHEEANRLLRSEARRRSRAEHELHEAHAELERVMSSIPDHLWSLQFDAEGRLELCFHSPVVEEITGRPPESFLGGIDPWLNIVHPDDEERVCQELGALRSGAQTRASLEYRIHRPDGTPVWVRDNIQATPGEDGTLRLDGVVTDITARKETEELERQHAAELAHVDRVNTMGRMASSIAHELTQPLFAIMNYAAACRRELQRGTPDQAGMLDDLEQIVEQGDRAGQIIRRLKDFMRLRQLERTDVDANELVRDTFEFLRSDSNLAGVSVLLELDEGVPCANGDEVLIQQVLLNLTKNALEAVIEHEESPQEVKITTTCVDSDAIEIAVADSGRGMPDEDIEQMFQPFFTTKADGLGMGLSICRSVVESHSGRLWADRNPEGGMTFRFTLPAAQYAMSGDDA